MRHAFYALPLQRQKAFRWAISMTRDGRASDRVEQAWADLDILGAVVDRTHTLDLYDRVADRLALTPKGERVAIEAALFKGALPCP